MISPARVVVVVFPFEPVIATIFLGRNWDASSISPITGSPEGPRLHQRRGIHRDAGTDYDEILSAEGAFAVSAGFDHDAVVEQDWDLFSRTGPAAWRLKP